MSDDKKSLRAIVEMSTNIEEQLIASGGEITEELDRALKEIDFKLPEKIDGYDAVMKRMDVVSDFYRKRAEMFLSMSKAAKNVVSRCKDNLRFAMQELEVKELNGNDIVFKLVKSNPAVEIVDEKLIDSAYTTIEQVIKVDKKRIAEDLKAGVPVEGASLKQNESLRGYPQKAGK